MTSTSAIPPGPLQRVARWAKHNGWYLLPHSAHVAATNYALLRARMTDSICNFTHASSELVQAHRYAPGTSCHGPGPLLYWKEGGGPPCPPAWLCRKLKTRLPAIGQKAQVLTRADGPVSVLQILQDLAPEQASEMNLCIWTARSPCCSSSVPCPARARCPVVGSGADFRTPPPPNSLLMSD